MKFFYLILLFLLSLTISAQKIYKVDYKYDANKDGLWYFVNYKYDADKTIYFVDYKYDANLIIYFCDYKYDVGWKNKSKIHLLR